MVTEKCFAKGSPAPGPVPKGHIRLYSMRFCPFAQRTRLVLNAKGIKYETINIHLKEKPEWFLERNPLGLVPAIETETGEVVYESPITCDYLDEVYPQNKLLPSTPFGKAKQKMMLEYFSKVIPCFYKIVTAKKNGEDVSGPVDELTEKFDKMDKSLVKKKTKFFGGDSITMIDYMIWPWFERLESFDLKHLLDSTPELKQWYGRMCEDPAVKASAHSTDAHKAFFKSAFIDGKPDYDYGL
ncbi:glutathione S-transferase omega-1-like [Boleophthalmus pectinirostris]|uniref:glutathione S-transferase omega-1-like n=1 Tax=Boleophthalmus pectinirostris TaxID=150288 RepID=UPI000A1C1A40|nr:glutathione S-transferase omega-1-like [Boleophthalmus pectinirostris]